MTGFKRVVSGIVGATLVYTFAQRLVVAGRAGLVEAFVVLTLIAYMVLAWRARRERIRFGAWQDLMLGGVVAGLAASAVDRVIGGSPGYSRGLAGVAIDGLVLGVALGGAVSLLDYAIRGPHQETSA